MVRACVLLMLLVLISGCAARGSARPAATATPAASLGAATYEAQSRCGKIGQSVASADAIEQLQTAIPMNPDGSAKAPFSQVGALRLISIFREQLSQAEAAGCELEAADVTTGAESLARLFWASEDGIPVELKTALVAPTASWILSLDPREQEAARTQMVQTMLLFKAANARTTIVYASPSAANLNDFRFRNELSSLKSQLAAAGIHVY